MKYLTLAKKQRKEIVDDWFEPYKLRETDEVFEEDSPGLVDGLKFGFWTNKYSNPIKVYTESGKYSIVPLNRYEVVRDLGGTSFEIRHNGYLKMLFVEKQVNSLVSVKDSIWTDYDEKGRVRQITKWVFGLMQWRKEFDDKGHLVKYWNEDLGRGNGFESVYIGKRLFSKRFFSRTEAVKESLVYYPDDLMSISNAQLYPIINFLEKKSDTQNVTIRANADVVIKSAGSNSGFVRIMARGSQPISFPLTLTAGSFLHLQIVTAPTSVNYKLTDTVNIVTNERKTPYGIYLHLAVHHMTVRTLENIDSIRLSRSKDRNLVLASMGTSTLAELTSKSGKKDSYNSDGLPIKIDLTKFEPGIYELEILSCNIIKKILLVLKP